MDERVKFRNNVLLKHAMRKFQEEYRGCGFKSEKGKIKIINNVVLNSEMRSPYLY